MTVEELRKLLEPLPDKLEVAVSRPVEGDIENIEILTKNQVIIDQGCLVIV